MNIQKMANPMPRSMLIIESDIPQSLPGQNVNEHTLEISTIESYALADSLTYCYVLSIEIWIHLHFDRKYRCA